MPQTPRWTEIPKYPVIVGIGLLATAVTIAWWAGADISALFASGYIRRGQIWRLFTAIFPHVDILHLAFNLYWLWIFGTVIERVLGHTKTELLIVLFAVGSPLWISLWTVAALDSRELATVYSAFFGFSLRVTSDFETPWIKEP